jgi:hypothetical protein
MVVDSGPTLATACCEDAEFTKSVTVVAVARQLGNAAADNLE